MSLDRCEGWALSNQFLEISEKDYLKIENLKNTRCMADLVSYVETGDNFLIPIVLGSTVNDLPILSHTFEGNLTNGHQNEKNLIPTALLYLNTPLLWGGRTPFGIDPPGFVQMVYKLNGYNLLRTAKQQSTEGVALSFIEESAPGDLAFFDDSEGIINHVGLIMENNHIIHVDGKVRIDRLDHTGIFNAEQGRYTNKLRVIKKIT